LLTTAYCSVSYPNSGKDKPSRRPCFAYGQMAADRKQCDTTEFVGYVCRLRLYVDHSISLQLFRVLSECHALSLIWIQPFLSDHTCWIFCNCQQSVTQNVQFSVPRGSVLGQLLYILRNLPTFYLRLRNDLYCVEWGVRLHSLTLYKSVTLHKYADNCHIYVSTTVDDATAAVSKLTACHGVWPTSMPA